MGGRNSRLHKSRIGDTNITVNIASNNKNYNIVSLNKDWKRKERQSESDEEPNVKSDQESRSCRIEEDKNNSPIPGKEELALQPTKFYVDEIDLSP